MKFFINSITLILFAYAFFTSDSYAQKEGHGDSIVLIKKHAELADSHFAPENFEVPKNYRRITLSHYPGLEDELKLLFVFLNERGLNYQPELGKFEFYEVPDFSGQDTQLVEDGLVNQQVSYTFEATQKDASGQIHIRKIVEIKDDLFTALAAQNGVSYQALIILHELLHHNGPTHSHRIISPLILATNTLMPFYREQMNGAKPILTDQAIEAARTILDLFPESGTYVHANGGGLVIVTGGSREDEIIGLDNYIDLSSRVKGDTKRVQFSGNTVAQHSSLELKFDGIADDAKPAKITANEFRNVRGSVLSVTSSTLFNDNKLIDTEMNVSCESVIEAIPYSTESSIEKGTCEHNSVAKGVGLLILNGNLNAVSNTEVLRGESLSITGNNNVILDSRFMGRVHVFGNNTIKNSTLMFNIDFFSGAEAVDSILYGSAGSLMTGSKSYVSRVRLINCRLGFSSAVGDSPNVVVKGLNITGPNVNLKFESGTSSSLEFNSDLAYKLFEDYKQGMVNDLKIKDANSFQNKYSKHAVPTHSVDWP